VRYLELLGPFLRLNNVTAIEKIDFNRPKRLI